MIESLNNVPIMGRPNTSSAELVFQGHDNRNLKVKMSVIESLRTGNVVELAQDLRVQGEEGQSPDADKYGFKKIRGFDVNTEELADIRHAEPGRIKSFMSGIFGLDPSVRVLYTSPPYHRKES